ncbi:MAG TPA: hypothetical protein VHR84_08490 [Terriglobales bacterium]|nr:hypothetical protein [Terriglobales bacterium]
MVLLAVRDEEALLRLVPRFSEAVREFEAELRARKDGGKRKQGKRSA